MNSRDTSVPNPNVRASAIEQNMSTNPNQQPIAIVGVSALFPGSTDATGFWRDILEGRDLITDVPASHWLVDDYYDPDPSAPDKTYAKRGGFLDPVGFDALGFGVPPSTMPATDTSQLLALILAQTVLQDAAREQFDTMDRSRISVILGVTSAQELLFSMVSRLQRPVWVKALRESGLPEDEVQVACERIAANYVPWQESSFPGLLGNVVAGRIANRLNLGGTNCVTDAACASALSAMSMAISELQLGNSDLVISGGVDTLNDIFMYMCFSKTPALSPTGDCRPFSDKADGTMLGEGLGMMALKRLSDAERDGDRIYAVIRGIGTSSDGRSKSVYAPVPEGQAKALRRAYALAGYSPETVELVEAHGTGTKAGDIAEFEGLRQVFDAGDTERKQWCALGSVKSQIGHTKAAAGAAGLFKAVMALHHKVLPPSIKIDAPNPKLDIEQSPFYLNTRTRPWIRSSAHPRRASVSAFGFGGSNFHVALEEYQSTAPCAERLPSHRHDLVVLMADDSAALVRKVRAIASGNASLTSIARESQHEFKSGASPRLAIVASDTPQLQARLLAAAQRIETAPGKAFALPDGSAYGFGLANGLLAMLFPGQGSHFPNMGSDLAVHFPIARAVWDRAADIQFDSGTSLHDVVFPRPGFTAESAKDDIARLTATQWTQPAIGATSLSMLAVLGDCGIRAGMVGGHSFGELVALHAAGVMTESDLLRVARKRGELMVDAAAMPGAMTALALQVEQVRELIAQHGASVVVANHNAPQQVVVSGELLAIVAFEAQLSAQGTAFRRLPVASGFHSRVVAGCCKPFAEYLSGIGFATPNLPVYGNASAGPYPTAPHAMRSELAAQIAQPVRFVEMVEAMHAAGARTFLEVGPGSVLTGLVGAILGDRPHTVISIDRKNKDGVESLLIALACLAAIGVDLRLDQLFASEREPVVAATHGRPLTLINGSNVGKPYPPPGGQQALPPPNPPRPAIPAAHIETSVNPGLVAAHPFENSPMPRNSVAAQPTVASDAWLHAFQDSQQQLAETHMAFQRSMFESHAAYLQVAESALSGLAAMVGGHTPSPMQPMLAAMQPVAPLAPIHFSALPVTQHAPMTAATFAAQAEMPNAHIQSTPTPVEPAPTSATAAVPNVDLTALMLQIVAEKTGYPVDMLNLGMDLEGDLGIDSIKRVEILAAVDERAPGLPKLDRSHMSALHTLAEIVDYLQGQQIDAVPDAVMEVAKPSTALPHAGLGRFRLELIAAPAAGMAQPGLLGGGDVWIVGDAVLGEHLAMELRNRRVNARCVDGLPDGANACIYLGGLREIAGIDEAIVINREAFAQARILAKTLESEHGLFVTVQDTGGTFGIDDMDPQRAWLAGLPALVKTAALEWPRASLKAIDLERSGRTPQALAIAIADELLEGGGEVEVALPASGGRHTLRSVAEPVSSGAPVIAAGDVVLVSGGARGVTATCIAEWANQCRARFVLLGRTPLIDEPASCVGITDEAGLKRVLLEQARMLGQTPTPSELLARVREVQGNREIRNTLAAIAQTGAEARYEAVDVYDTDALVKTLARVRSEWGPIAGVVHAAGVLADKRIAEKTDAQFDHVFNTKVEGLRALLAATHADPLKLLCVFSSVSARCGNVGQSDYAMANEVLVKVALAESRRRTGLVAKSFGWGPWEGGMVTPHLRERFAELGVPMIPLDVGARMFAAELSGGQRDQVELVLGGEPRPEALLFDGASERVQELEITVARASHAYLEGHAINGQPVLPLVLAAEWLSRAARSFRPGLPQAALHEIKVLKGIRLGGFENGGDRLTIQATPLPSERGVQMQMQIRDSKGHANYSARIELLPEPNHSDQPMDALALEPWQGEPLYQNLLFHRGAFELIQQLDGISDQGIAATLHGVSHAGWNGESWQLDVAALDAGLQMAVLYGQRMLGGPNLPTGIDQIRTFGASPSDGLLNATAFRRKLGPTSVTTDIVFTNDSGRRVAELLGVHNHALNTPALSRA